ncbi:unnamed protein product [Cylicocyclus nassatus]|uniref:Uncharacterized protein n=1 Tax=Cylicocyclus nassatus TaxID=53992 RepID=A0AA36GPZ4_CYLNA|nr:unnamed protein product [Cylicocyclus nassatus]
MHFQGLVDGMEKQAVEIDNNKGNSEINDTKAIKSYPIKPEQSAMDLSLVPPNSGFSPGSNQDFHQQPMHIITDGVGRIDDTHWTEWGSWAECFCEKQVRTRRCMYTGAMSSGCEGSSFESRSCTGGWCPVSPDTVRPEMTTARPEETSKNPKDPRRQFRPHHLRTATSLS